MLNTLWTKIKNVLIFPKHTIKKKKPKIITMPMGHRHNSSYERFETTSKIGQTSLYDRTVLERIEYSFSHLWDLWSFVLTTLNEPMNTDTFCFDWLLINVAIEKISSIWRRSNYRWRVAIFRPVLGINSLWAGRDFYRATDIITQGLVFCSFICRIISIN